MADDTDMTSAEFRATRASGIPVEIVTSREEYAARVSPYDHTFQVTAWKSGWREPYWFLDIECPKWALSDTELGHWGTQAPWLCLAEYMVKDYLVCMLNLDYRYWDQITVEVVRGVGPSYDWDYSLPGAACNWLWAQYAGVKDAFVFWRVRRLARRRNR